MLILQFLVGGGKFQTLEYILGEEKGLEGLMVTRSLAVDFGIERGFNEEVGLVGTQF